MKSITEANIQTIANCAVAVVIVVAIYKYKMASIKLKP